MDHSTLSFCSPFPWQCRIVAISSCPRKSRLSRADSQSPLTDHYSETVECFTYPRVIVWPNHTMIILFFCKRITINFLPYPAKGDDGYIGYIIIESSLHNLVSTRLFIMLVALIRPSSQRWITRSTAIISRFAESSKVPIYCAYSQMQYNWPAI